MFQNDSNVHPQLFSQISLLPESLQTEVADFVEFLLEKKLKNEEPIQKRQFGCAKGLIKMSADFDAPLDDFKEYM